MNGERCHRTDQFNPMCDSTPVSNSISFSRHLFIAFSLLFLQGCDATRESSTRYYGPFEHCSAFGETEDLSQYYSLDENTIDRLRGIHESAPTRAKTILSLGDSISFSDCFLWHERTRLNRPGMLSTEGYIYVPKTLGCQSGVTSEWGRKNSRSAIEQSNAELTTILFGTNDLQKGQHDVDRFIQNIAVIVDASVQQGTIPIVFTIPPAKTISEAPLQRFNEAIAKLAKEKNVPIVYTDRLFRDFGGFSDLCFDGVHPNTTPEGNGGYDLINGVFRQIYKRIETEVFGRNAEELGETKLGTDTDDAGRRIEIYDRNADGIADLWVTELSEGIRTEKYDSDFDQQIDVEWQFEQGQLMKGMENMARDGSSWIPFEMREGWKNETP